MHVIQHQTRILSNVTDVQCDPKCHPTTGCSVRGEGKCDSKCVNGYGVNLKTYQCISRL